MMNSKNVIINNPDIIVISSTVEDLGRLEIGVCPKKGAGITHFVLQDNHFCTHLFRPVDEKNFKTNSSEFFACFPLVPFSGRIKDAKFHHDGRQIQLNPNPPELHALHGDGWKSSWKVVKQGDSYITLQLENPERGWPWNYMAQYSIACEKNNVRLELSYTNLSEEVIPVGLGFHPWFLSDAYIKTQLETRWNIDDRYLFTDKTDTKEEYTGNNFLDVSNLDLVHGFSGWNQQAEIKWKTHPYKIKLRASKNLKHAVLYTQHPSKDWCFEPVSHSVDAFNLHYNGITDTGTIFVKPNETITAWSVWEIIKEEK